MNTTSSLMALWKEARKRFSDQLSQVNTDDLRKKISPNSKSIGFLIRHIGDVELLFAKNVFKDSRVSVIAKTVIDQKDSGEWNNLDELLNYTSNSFLALESIISNQTEENWSEFVETKEFGTKSKAEAFGRIISHTTYHAGQIALIRKYGN